jgi:peptidoglycan/LPS O-acetylase OafA/YrhL
VLLYGGSRFLSTRTLIAIPIAWLVALPLLRWPIVRHVAPSDVPGLTYFPFHTHSDGLAAGLIIAWIAIMKPKLMKSGFWENAAVLIGGVALALILRRVNQFVFRFSSLALLYGSMTFFLLRVRTVPRLASWHGFYIISRLSYGMYLNQFHVLDFIPRLMPLAGTGLTGFAICWTVSLIASLAVAFVTFAIIEVPFLKLREHWLARTVPGPAVPAPLFL